MFQLLHDDREAFWGGDGPDMVMVMGTSLKVGPVNMIPSLFPGVPRVLINRCGAHTTCLMKGMGP